MGGQYVCRGLWNLANMLRFSGHRFFQISHRLTTVRVVASGAKEKALSDSDRKSVQNKLDAIVPDCKALNLDMTMLGLHRFRESLLQIDITHADVERLVSDLLKRMYDELSL